MFEAIFSAFNVKATSIKISMDKYFMFEEYVIIRSCISSEVIKCLLLTEDLFIRC